MSGSARRARRARRADGERACRARRPRVVGLIADNGADWVAADLAAQKAGVVLVPLPAFFTDAQRATRRRERHGRCARRAAARLSRPPAHRRPALLSARRRGRPRCRRAPPRSPSLPAPPARRRACPEQRAAMGGGARAGRSHPPAGIRRHLCVLPLAVLLENIAGVYAPLAGGMEFCVPPLAEVGLQRLVELRCRALPCRDRALAGRQRDPAAADAAPRCAPRSSTARGRRARSKFVAVGGASCLPSLLAAAHARSACRPTKARPVRRRLGGRAQPARRRRPGSVGRAAAACAAAGSCDGEIQVQTPRTTGWPTGDLGTLDADGFLHVEGRRKNVLITAFGRNVSPEWVETELLRAAGDRAGGGVRRSAGRGCARDRAGAGRARRRDRGAGAGRQRAPARLRAHRRLGARRRRRSRRRTAWPPPTAGRARRERATGTRLSRSATSDAVL